MYLTVQMDGKILQTAAKSSLSFLYHLDKQVDQQLWYLDLVSIYHPVTHTNFHL